MQFLDKHGWPVERVRGRRVLNFLRLLIHTRKIRRGIWRLTATAILNAPPMEQPSINMGIPSDVLAQRPKHVTATEQEILRREKGL